MKSTKYIDPDNQNVYHLYCTTTKRQKQQCKLPIFSSFKTHLIAEINQNWNIRQKLLKKSN